MQDFAGTFAHSMGLILSGDAELWAVVLLSLKVSLLAFFCLIYIYGECVGTISLFTIVSFLFFLLEF